MTPKQIEMDAVEELILQLLLGADWRSNKIFVLLNAYRPNMLQDYINKFEAIVGPFMSENGAVNGYLLRSALRSKGSTLADLIPDREFRLTDVAGEIIKLVRG